MRNIVTFIWSAIATFTAAYGLDLWGLTRGDVHAPLQILTFCQKATCAPLFGWFGVALFLIPVLALARHYAKVYGGPVWYQRVPLAWLPEGAAHVVYDNSKFAKRFVAVIIIVLVCFPIASQIHFIRTFHGFSAWISDHPFSEVGLYDPRAAKNALDHPFSEWVDAHRYGDHKARIDAPNDKAFGGVSYWPLVEPIIMWLLSFLNGYFLVRWVIDVFTSDGGEELQAPKSANASPS